MFLIYNILTVSVNNNICMQFCTLLNTQHLKLKYNLDNLSAIGIALSIYYSNKTFNCLPIGDC